jgi:hypothetical protein
LPANADAGVPDEPVLPELFELPPPDDDPPVFPPALSGAVGSVLPF